MATPQVAAAAALVIQYLQRDFYDPNITITASLVKAMLINSAVRMTGYCLETECLDFASNSPNQYQGFGRIQLNRYSQ